MALAATAYPRSNSLQGELQPYRPHQPPLSASKESQEKRSSDQKGFSNRLSVHALRFGRFHLVLHSRELLAGGIPLSIGNRAMDVLFVLIEARGELVTKDELLDRAWPNTTVEENNLQFQVSTLRKALGEDRDLIRTVSGRGYRFVAEVTPESRAPHPVLENAALDKRDEAASQMRDQTDLDKFVTDTAAHRLVALTVAEGIGKMRLAFELARRAVPTFANDMGVAECGRVLVPERVPTTVVSAPGLDTASATLERAAASLNPQHLLRLLDSCEHIIETVTSVAEVLLQANAKL
jgi:DNA-binding winged helix-turn-helix (wHTH) protein